MNPLRSLQAIPNGSMVATPCFRDLAPEEAPTLAICPPPALTACRLVPRVRAELDDAFVGSPELCNAEGHERVDRALGAFQNSIFDERLDLGLQGGR